MITTVGKLFGLRSLQAVAVVVRRAHENFFIISISNVQATSDSLTAARSRIQDADFASETAALTRSQILQQAGVSILAQANSLPQLALSLLG
jgi:flagellin